MLLVHRAGDNAKDGSDGDAGLLCRAERSVSPLGKGSNSQAGSCWWQRVGIGHTRNAEESFGSVMAGI